MKRTTKTTTSTRRPAKRQTSTKRASVQLASTTRTTLPPHPADEVASPGASLKINELANIAPEEEVHQQFRESHTHIKKTIVDAPPPTNEINIVADMTVSRIALGEYVTLDWDHYEAIKNLIQKVQDYTKDPTRRRPFNIVMHAEPGSGKSHFIRSFAKRLKQDRVKPVEFNMSSVRRVEDFIQPLEEVRNLKVVDEIPLLFLDEFDSDRSNYSLLLPLLWEGEFSVGQGLLRMGKVLIIMAGSNKEIDEVMRRLKGMRPGNDEAGKLPDLLSRINGGELKIPDLDEVTPDRDRRVDKVCLTIALLTRRFPLLRSVPWAFLRFVADTRFRYSVRSISNLIDLIPAIDKEKTTLEMPDLQLPLDVVDQLKASSLATHLIAEDGPAAVIERWNKLKSINVAVIFRPPPRDLSKLSFTDILRKYFEDK